MSDVSTVLVQRLLSVYCPYAGLYLNRDDFDSALRRADVVPTHVDPIERNESYDAGRVKWMLQSPDAWQRDPSKSTTSGVGSRQQML